MSRPRHWVRDCASLLLLCGLLLLHCETATAAPAGAGGKGIPFATSLDWSSDSASDQANRLGHASAAYAHTTAIPMSGSGGTYLDQFFGQAAAAGSGAIIEVNPSIALNKITRKVASDFAADLASALHGRRVTLYVDFAPQMNTTWVSWGQQPAQYRQAYQFVSAAVHASIPTARMVWSPAWGGGYPFRSSRPAHGASLRQMDTSHDGTVDARDDAYSPYFPGAAAVDWVGLVVYHDDTNGGAPRNTVPAAEEFAGRLGPASGASSGADSFYSRYAAALNKPLLVQTGAFYSVGAGGPSAVSVKQTWWRQIIAAVQSGQYPLLSMTLWPDLTSTRGAIGNTFVDWSISRDPSTRSAFLHDIRNGGLKLGRASSAITGVRAGIGLSIGGASAWAIVAAVLAAALALWLLAGPAARRGLAYQGPAGRDLRIDFLRGVAIAFVVIDHAGVLSLLQDASQERLGVFSGAELFVLLSGTVLGMIYRPKLIAGGIGEVVLRCTSRARKLYVTALCVVLVVLVIKSISAVDSTYVTTFADQGSGAGGANALGRIYSLYANSNQLTSYPANPHVIVSLFMLQMGPWQFNVMGLYIVLIAVAPLALWMLTRRWSLVVLAASWGLYVLELFFHFRLLPSQFEDSFPLLSWQVLFFTGMVGGYHRREIVEWFGSRLGKAVLAVVVAAALAGLLYTWNNPYLASPLDARLTLVPHDTFTTLYAEWFGRTYLQVGRLLNVFVAIIALYALLTAYWKPIFRAVGWLFVPLGQATLYVFVLHVFVVLAFHNIRVVETGSAWVGAAAEIIAIAVLWLMVKRRILFQVIPR